MLFRECRGTVRRSSQSTSPSAWRRDCPSSESFPSKQAPVLIISEEDYPKHLKKRFESLGITENDSDHLSFSRLVSRRTTRSTSMTLPTSSGGEVLKLVIIDCLRRVHDQDENDSRGMAKVAEGLRRIASEGVAVLYTHHHRKQEDFKPKDHPTVSLRGSTEIQAAIENHFAIERKENEARAHIPPAEIAQRGSPEAVRSKDF